MIAVGIHALATIGRPAAAAAPVRDLWRGVIVNVTSPHPWIFWIGAGAPLLVSAWRDSPILGVLFLVGFYSLLIGSKIVLAWVAAATGERLSTVWRRRLITIGGLTLIAGGAFLIWQAAAGRL